LSVQTQQDLDDKTLKAMLLQKEQEKETLKFGIEIQVKDLKDQLEIRNILMSEDSLTLTSWQHHHLIFLIRYTCDYP
jgi:hypothetical protein